MLYTKEEFIKTRKEIIRKDFGRMNNMQLEAVVTAKGPLLVLAGAGSGKTTVLVNRIACLVKYGDAYNSTYVPNISREEWNAGKAFLQGVSDYIPSNAFCSFPANPYEILAITFTNKAAGELKSRIANRLGDMANDIWAGTFHSICARILRRYGDLLGYSSNFTIYDTDDQKRVIKDILKRSGIGEKELPPKYIQTEISRAKDSLITPDEYKANTGNYPLKKAVAEVFKIYQSDLKKADAMDFDDIIFNTVKLFSENPEVLEYYQNKFKYIMVDEYQDTNRAQYKLISLLAEKHKNICVVGDDDQSIYSFRGATIENILNFEDEYKDSKVIRLEQNYRSTSTILSAANNIIANNKGRKGKNLWTDKQDDSKITVNTLMSEQEEAKFVCESILESVRLGGKFSNNAVLYRMNALSGTLENVFVRSGIPYKVIGGHRFFDRKEIKDVIAYLQVINNKNDNVRLKRIINEPKRGIGDTTVKNAEEIADRFGVSVFEVLREAENYPILSRSAAKLKAFCNMIEELEEINAADDLDNLLDAALKKTGYMDALIAEGADSAARVENVKELMSGIRTYIKESPDPSLANYLEEISLISDIDGYDENEDSVILMTLHSAKGLEFDNVYMVGMEEGVFPGNQSIYGGEAELEEERRLAYVGVTRAKKKLYLTNTYTRMLFGTTNRNAPSRFLKEIPEELCEISGYRQKTVAGKFEREKESFTPYREGSLYNGGKSADIFGSDTAKTSVEGNRYKKGMRVKHKIFGEGMVISSTPMGGDFLLEIAFDQKGTKKLMANFVKMEIIN